MQKIDKTLQAKLQSRPQDTVRLIVRVQGDVSQAATRLNDCGTTVLRSFSLIKAVSVSSSAKIALGLLKEPWVLAIEEDRKVSAQDTKALKKP